MCAEIFSLGHLHNNFKLHGSDKFLQNWWIINEAVEVYDHSPEAIKVDLSEKVSGVVFSS